MKYIIKRQLSDDEQAKLSSFSSLTSHLLFHRGVENKDDAEKFLNPDYDCQVHDPFLLKDLEKSSLRVIKAIENNERIAIYADYDADGLPGAAMFDDFFDRIGYKNSSIYIPHRHDEGFGLNGEAVDQLANEGVKLLITVDCGIADIEPIRHANILGMEVIITDHHEPPAVLPPAFAIIDHKQVDCTYPEKNLCGSGVAFKLIQGVLAKNRFGLKEGIEKWLLDLVGIATLSDMVPLVGENRIFAYFGLAVLKKSPRKGLSKLFDKLRLSRKHLSEDDITFMITPRINAASRMGTPMDAFLLLSAKTEKDAEIHVSKLEHINNERKGVVASLVKEIKKKVRDRYGAYSLPANVSDTVDGKMPRVIVLGNPDWRPSLLGLAANSCAEEFGRPVFLWGRDGGDIIKGSCRSEGSTHVTKLMNAVSAGVFTQFGGHRHSGGFAVANDAIYFLEQRLNEAAERLKQIANISNNNTEESEESDRDHIEVDAELTLEAINWTVYDEVARFAPFGAGNHKPTFLLRRIAPYSIRRFGKGSEHVELSFKKPSGEKISAISFFGAENEWAKTIEVNKPIDLIASLEKSVFRGDPELRLRVVEVVE